MKNDEIDTRLIISLLVGMLIVYSQHRSARALARVFIAGLSGAIGYIVSPELDIPYIGEYSEVVVVTAFSYAIIDIVFGVLRDRALIIGTLRQLLGVKGGN